MSGHISSDRITPSAWGQLVSLADLGHDVYFATCTRKKGFVIDLGQFSRAQRREIDYYAFIFNDQTWFECDEEAARYCLSTPDKTRNDYHPLTVEGCKFVLVLSEMNRMGFRHGFGFDQRSIDDIIARVFPRACPKQPDRRGEPAAPEKPAASDSAPSQPAPPVASTRVSLSNDDGVKEVSNALFNFAVEKAADKLIKFLS